MKIDTSNAVQILLLVGGLSLVPALLFCVTGFSRILIVLGFIRTAMGTQNTPPNQVLVGIALFLTLFVMMPDDHRDQEPRRGIRSSITRSARPRRSIGPSSRCASSCSSRPVMTSCLCS